MKNIFGRHYLSRKDSTNPNENVCVVVAVACCVGWLAVWAVRGGGAM